MNIIRKLITMKNFVTAIAAGIILCVFASPFVLDMYSRYTTQRGLGPVLTEHDRVALNYWEGDMASFISFILARCKQSMGPDAKACQAYSY